MTDQQQNRSEAESEGPRTVVPDAARRHSGPAHPDVESDPARDDRTGSDWADEGGATPTGPATSAPAPGTDEDDQDSEEADATEHGTGKPQQRTDGAAAPISLDPPD